MDLIFWRHAEAEDLPAGGADLERALTSRGEEEAARMAAWLDRHLPQDALVLCSPALRCEQTAWTLGRPYRIATELAPGNDAEAIVCLARRPGAIETVLVVGHQPALGQAAARLLHLKADGCAIRKGAVWWLRTRERQGHRQTVVVAVQSPRLL